ncbi:MAG: glycosyltransferase family 4 protein [Deltaproteobacteria bacterium]|jgi:glycosyltransferase involved in cell wall biosynthesis|nr:glycosyltransferase family 4 protein [Deltaproteobacteria bacterium]
MIKNIGFVSTRFAGLDGVSLEAGKWGDVLESEGYNCFWFAGELDKDPDKSYLAHEAHFKHPYNVWINRQIFGTTNKTASVGESIENLRRILKARLQDFIAYFHIDLLIVENALAIPLNIPLGLALAELISETQIATIAHHHDFYWERDRFAANCVAEYLHECFPPQSSNIQHVVINSIAQDDLLQRRNIRSTIIPNVLDFDHPPATHPNSFKDFLASFGLKPGHKTILQPTRIIQRKGIEHAIELVKRLGGSHYKLLISHEAGDEGWEYAGWLKNYALDNGVDLRLAQKPIASPWQHPKQGINGNSLWNIYQHADFVTFPSRYEGFGNAFIEAVYLKKPLLVNRYAAFVSDIEPKGFDLVTMDATLTAETVQTVSAILESPRRAAEMVDHNYEIARRHFSYGVLKNHLVAVLDQALGRKCVAQNAVGCRTRSGADDLSIGPQIYQFACLKN